jgi:hypothetical protein
MKSQQPRATVWYSIFALLCIIHTKMNKVNRIIELGAGNEVDPIFFTSTGIEVCDRLFCYLKR